MTQLLHKYSYQCKKFGHNNKSYFISAKFCIGRCRIDHKVQATSISKIEKIAYRCREYSAQRTFVYILTFYIILFCRVHYFPWVAKRVQSQKCACDVGYQMFEWLHFLNCFINLNKEKLFLLTFLNPIV